MESSGLDGLLTLFTSLNSMVLCVSMRRGHCVPDVMSFLHAPIFLLSCFFPITARHEGFLFMGTA